MSANLRVVVIFRRSIIIIIRAAFKQWVARGRGRDGREGRVSGARAKGVGLGEEVVGNGIMEFFGFSFQTGKFHEEFLFRGDEGGFPEVGDFFAEFLFEKGRFGGLGGGGHCNVCGNDFRCLFCFNYLLWETEGLVERSFFFLMLL